MLRATARLSADHGRGIPFDLIILAADERRIRRKLLTLTKGEEVLVDFPEAITLEDRDMLVLEDGRLVEIVAADENVYEITGRDSEHLTRLAWHLGNRHLPAQIEKHRILITRDHVIKDMLIGLGASVKELSAPFAPEHGAYHGHAHSDSTHALFNRK
jgi:urease accessory protein